MGSVNSISSPLAVKSFNHWGTPQRTRPGTLQDQLGWAGRALHRVVEESGPSFLLTKGAKNQDGLVGRGADEALGVCGSKGQALEARGPRLIYTPLAGCMTSANRVPSAKPQSPHLPSGAKSFVFPAGASHRRSIGSLNCSL